MSVPFTAYTSVPREPLAGTTVIDTGNYAPQRDGRIEALDDGATTSSELFQRHLGASAHVVKAFDNIHHTHLAVLTRPAGAEDRTALPLAGDDAGAKRHAAELLDALGYDTVDAGPSRRAGCSPRAHPRTAPPARSCPPTRSAPWPPAPPRPGSSPGRQAASAAGIRALLAKA
ncbi:NADP oxidoreductase [Streptomyces sp. NPDC019937]|uniref:NADPH-dependent F420 reductase n=1 Tax=Streptomyces sp. NPDC019937 TaxID=3154787 RepID=UPI0033D5E66D